MTTIAWDGKTLAADRQITFNAIKEGSITKILKRKKDGILLAASGALPLAYAFHQWFLAGGKGKPPPCKVDDSTCAVQLLYPSGKLVSYDKVGKYEKKLDVFAEGTGYELALGAMAAGATAEEAVRIASRFDTKTGSEVDTLEFN